VGVEALGQTAQGGGLANPGLAGEQADAVEEACRGGAQRWARGISACRRLFQSG